MPLLRSPVRNSILLQAISIVSELTKLLMCMTHRPTIKEVHLPNSIRSPLLCISMGRLPNVKYSASCSSNTTHFFVEGRKNIQSAQRGLNHARQAGFE